MAKLAGRSRVAAVTFALLGFRAGAFPIADNSTLTHLRTGMDIVRTGHFPRHDVYSYTGYHLAWTPQSWFPEWIYGLALRLNESGHVLLLVNALILGVLAFCMASLASSDSLAKTVGYSAIATAIGFQVWAPRPTIVAFLCFALLLRLLHSNRSVLWTIPVAVVWQWSHGSYVIGGGFLLLYWLGCALDKGDVSRPRKMVGLFSVALLAASLFPYGPHTLFFFLVPFHRPDVFHVVSEWRSPDFQTPAALIMLLGIGYFVLVLSRFTAPWRYRIPALVFLLASLYSFRNVGFLSLVVASTLGFVANSEFTAAEKPNTSRVDRLLMAMIVLIAVIEFAGTTNKPSFDLAAYPTKATTWMEKNGYLANSLPIAQREVVGNYLICRYGSSYRVFDDDRFDFYPIKHEDDNRTLLTLTDDPGPVLDRNHVDVVLWRNKEALVQWLKQSTGWERVYFDKKFSVYVRRGVHPTQSVTTDPASPCAPARST